MSKQQLISRTLPLLSRDQERILFNKVAKGCKKSRELAILHNIPLAVKISGRYFIDGYSFDDILSIATMEMIRAVDDFDCSRGFKFSTLATKYIWRGIDREKKRYRAGNGIKFRHNCEGLTPFPGITMPFAQLNKNMSSISTDTGNQLYECVACSSSSMEMLNIDYDINVKCILESISESDRKFAEWSMDEKTPSEWEELTGETRSEIYDRRKRIRKAMHYYGCVR